MQQLTILSDSWSKSTGPTKLRSIFVGDYVQKSIHAAVLDTCADLMVESPDTLWNLSELWSLAKTAAVEAIANPKFTDLQQSPMFTEQLASLGRFMDQIKKEQLANHKRKAIASRLNDTAKRQYMSDPFELDDGGNERSRNGHELIREYCIKHMSTMLEKGPPKGNFWESYSALYNNSPVNSAMFRNNTQKDKRQQQREQYSADTQQALKDGAPEWLAQRSKDTRDRMDELVMESTNVITMSLTDEAKGHIQGLFLISPNQLDDMIGWIHSKYTGTGQDQANSQTPIEANSSQQPGASNPQLHSQTAQSTQGPAPERQPLDLFSLRHKETAPNSTRTGQPDRAQPVQQQQPHTPQQASPQSQYKPARPAGRPNRMQASRAEHPRPSEGPATETTTDYHHVRSTYGTTSNYRTTKHRETRPLETQHSSTFRPAQLQYDNHHGSIRERPRQSRRATSR